MSYVSSVVSVVALLLLVRPGYRAAKTHRKKNVKIQAPRIHHPQGLWSDPFCTSFFAKEPLIIGLFCRK